VLVKLGQRRAATDLVGALLECHERIRSMSGLAATVADRLELPAAEIDDACARVARYFSESLPLHVRDEEDSILPRLGGRSTALDDTLAEMHAQHQSHEAPLRQLIDLCAQMRAAPEAAVRSAFRDVARHLQEELRRHLELEETRLFPALRTKLGLDEQAAILAELRARRHAL
jgi:iron-sulfur cluster repair protein YtfE (RIC family)